MLTVVPYKYFRKYLATTHPDELVFLNMYGITFEIITLQKMEFDAKKKDLKEGMAKGSWETQDFPTNKVLKRLNALQEEAMNLYEEKKQ